MDRLAEANDDDADDGLHCVCKISQRYVNQILWLRFYITVKVVINRIVSKNVGVFEYPIYIYICDHGLRDK